MKDSTLPVRLRFGKSRLRSRTFAISAATLAIAPLASAVTTTNWNGTVDLDWQNAANWSAGVPNNAGANTFTAQFLSATSPSTGQVVDVNGFAAIAQLQIGNTVATNATTAFTIGNSQNNLGGALTITGNAFDSTNSAYLGIQTGTAQTSRVTISSNVVFAPGSSGSNIRINLQGADVLISGSIGQTAGANAGLVKYGGSLLELSGANTYSGVTTVQQNSIYLQGDAPSGLAGTLGNSTNAVQLGNAETKTTQGVGLITDGNFTVGRDVTVNTTAATGAITLGGALAAGPNGAQTISSYFTGTINLNASRAVSFQSATSGTNAVDFQGPITGVGSILKTGSGTLRLDNVNSSFTGNTDIRVGTVVLTANAPSGANGTLGNNTNAVLLGDASSANAGNATLLTTGAVSVGHDIIVYGSGTVGVSATIGANGTLPATTSYFTGAITLNSPNATTFQSSTTGTNVVDFQGPISGVGSVLKTTAGAVQFDNAANSYTGGTVIRNGTLILTANAPSGANGTLGNSTNAVSLGDSGSGSAAKPALLLSGNVSIGRDLTIYNGSNNSTVTIGGQANNTSGANFSGAVNLGNGTTLVNLQSYAAEPAAADFSGYIAGLNGFDTTGPGVVRLDGPGNTYAGTTIVGADGQGGTLRVNTANTGGGAYSVQTASTLTGIGSVITGAGTNGIEIAGAATFAPGSATATGTFTVTGDTTLDGTLALKLNAVTSDLLVDSGVLNLDPGSTLNLSTLATPSAPVYVLATYSTLNGTFGSVNGIPAGYSLNYAYGGNEVALVAVPEPTGVFAVAVLAAPLFLRRRRRV